MNKVIEINIKSEQQTVSMALGEFLLTLDRAKFSQVEIIKVITGYGSHGIGGEIKSELDKLLFKLKRERKIKDYFKGEQLAGKVLSSLFVEYPELIVDREVNSYNSGIVLVLV